MESTPDQPETDPSEPAIAPAPEEDFAAELKALREAAGLSQDKAADLLGTTQATMSRWESRQLPINKRTILAARQELGAAAAQRAA
jgi:transcriptional regulator with XRE-family HTH domain